MVMVPVLAGQQTLMSCPDLPLICTFVGCPSSYQQGQVRRASWPLLNVAPAAAALAQLKQLQLLPAVLVVKVPMLMAHNQSLFCAVLLQDECCYGKLWSAQVWRQPSVSGGPAC